MRICENSTNKGSPILYPGCHGGVATRVLTIKYDKHGVERQNLLLCENCAKLIQKDAKKHGYITSRGIFR